MSFDPEPRPREGPRRRRRSRRGPALARAALLAAAVALPAAEGRAQAGAGPGRPAAPADSAAILEAARAAQARFERTRVAHLPWTWPRSRGTCDERIGRFCWWHDDGEGDAWTPPPEPVPVVEAREALLAELARSAEHLPGDAWIVGQRVRYAVEAGRAGEAEAVARASRADPAWRAALEGYALHAAGSFAAAEAAFERALGAFPDSTRARWSDPDALLDPRAGRVRDRLGPGARAAFDRRLWWLADPMWSVPGNERRSEHFARLALDRMQAGARSTWGVRWGADLREILLRYGPPTGWERVRRRADALGGGGVALVGHEPPGGRRFVPAWEVLGGPTVAPREGWALQVERPRSTYAAPYARRFLELDGQVAVFRRGARAAVVATWSLAPDSLAPDAPVEAAVVASEGPDAAPAFVRAARRGATGALRLDAPLRPAVLSVEALAREARVAGRARLALPLPGRVSGLLLVDPGSAPGDVPSTLEAAEERAVPVARATPGRRIGVYAELYPPEAATEARIEVRVAAADGGGFWRAVGEALGLGGEPSTATLAWTEPLDGAPAKPIPFTVRWPERAEGPHVVEVEVVWPDGRRSVASAPVRGGP